MDGRMLSSVEPRPIMVAIGDFVFLHRNWLFPILVVGLFASATPPGELFSSVPLERLEDHLAVLICVAGLVVRGLVIGFEHVRRAGEGKRIHADQLKTGGMFSLCRNPLYVGNILIACGIFLKHGNPFVVGAGILLYVLIYICLVRAEEHYLLSRFGDEYRRYCAAVPRWRPMIGRWKQAIDGMRFSWARVLLVEYTNIGLTLAVLLVEAIYEASAATRAGDQNSLPWLIAALGAVLVWIGAVRFIKKRRLIAPD